MKNLLICLCAFFCFLITFAENRPQDQDEINANIEQFLSNAEKAINEVDFDEALNQLKTALDLSKSINHKRYIALSSSILAQLYYVRHDLDKAATELQRAVAKRDAVVALGVGGRDAGLAEIFRLFFKVEFRHRVAARGIRLFHRKGLSRGRSQRADGCKHPNNRYA